MFIKCRNLGEAPIVLTKQLAGHRGFLRHMTSGGSGMTSVFEITTLDVKKARALDLKMRS